VLRSGASYFYCPSMKLVADAPCCDGDRHSHDAATDDLDRSAPSNDVTLEVRSRDCCEQHFIAKLPAIGEAARAPIALAPPLVATLPAPSAGPSTNVASLAPRTFTECRAGPIALARHRAELMVALN
jgi:hypothetical protein